MSLARAVSELEAAIAYVELQWSEDHDGRDDAENDIRDAAVRLNDIVDVPLVAELEKLR